MRKAHLLSALGVWGFLATFCLPALADELHSILGETHIFITKQAQGQGAEPVEVVASPLASFYGRAFIQPGDFLVAAGNPETWRISYLAEPSFREASADQLRLIAGKIFLRARAKGISRLSLYGFTPEGLHSSLSQEEIVRIITSSLVSISQTGSFLDQLTIRVNDDGRFAELASNLNLTAPHVNPLPHDLCGGGMREVRGNLNELQAGMFRLIGDLEERMTPAWTQLPEIGGGTGPVSLEGRMVALANFTGADSGEITPEGLVITKRINAEDRSTFSLRSEIVWGRLKRVVPDPEIMWGFWGTLETADGERIVHIRSSELVYVLPTPTDAAEIEAAKQLRLEYMLKFKSILYPHGKERREVRPRTWLRYFLVQAFGHTIVDSCSDLLWSLRNRERRLGSPPTIFPARSPAELEESDQAQYRAFHGQHSPRESE